MNRPTTYDSIAEQLQYREAEVKHLNAVNQELQKDLTKAKLRIKELSMNKSYLKGPGDFEPDCKPEPSDDQIISATRNNPEAVAKNAIESFSMELTSALFMLAKFDSDEQLRDVINKSAADLLERGEV